METGPTERRAQRPADRPSQRAMLELLPGPLAGAAVGAGVATEAGGALETALVCFMTLLLAAAVADRRPRHAGLLPFVRILSRLTAPLLGVFLLGALEILTALPGIGASALASVGLTAAGATLLGELLARRIGEPGRCTVVAIIGDGEAADGLAAELSTGRRTDFVLRGRISLADHDDAGGRVPALGSLDRLGTIVEEQGIDLLLMTADVPRLRVFDEISRSCLHLPVRLQELANFYEDVFGHVPVAEINAAWFQYIMHPRYRSRPPVAQRTVDVVVSALGGVLVLPLVAVLALLIRRDGGPALYGQLRIGQGGRPFRIWKLRTMAVGSSGAWAGAEDPRVTGIGRWLRRTHLDELPQLYNVLLGEMSLVGPRPEQPSFVERLERTVPFYSRRHLIKPGLTGWAQIRCGYAGSDLGSAWKVSHDLFYLKHKSLRLNLMILAETLRAVVADRQYEVEPPKAFIVRSVPKSDATGEWPALSAPLTDAA